MAVAPSLSVVAKMAAPCCTSAVQMAVSLHEAAQCSGVLGGEAGARGVSGRPRGARSAAAVPSRPVPRPPPPARARAHQPWLSGELTLAPAAMRKSTMG